MEMDEFVKKYQDQTVYFVKFNNGLATFETDEFKVVFKVWDSGPFYYSVNLGILLFMHNIHSFEIKK